MNWNDRYTKYNKVWGDCPSELALIAVLYFRDNGIETKGLGILDVACGYGRDTFYLQQNLECRVTGIDTSARAIAIANASFSTNPNGFVKFTQSSFMDFSSSAFDMLFVSKFYHLLDRQERKRFLKAAKDKLKLNGLLFLSTHSISDPQFYEKGIPHPTETDSFYDNGIYCHFSSAVEMQRDFDFLEINKLYEHEYLEPRNDGKPHHHISWILIGKRI